MSPGPGCAQQVRDWQAHMERALAQRLPASDTEPTRLHAAMRYVVLDGGERLHPLLLFGTAAALGLAQAQVEAGACALELIHAYARVHDDLPALDGGGGRGGRRTCHEAYDEGTAVLAGDALQSLAFQLLAADESLPPSADVRLRLITLLTEAIGVAGLTGGQSLDIEAHGRHLGAAELEAICSRRSGSLIRASVLMAAECAPQLSPALQQSLGEFATALALALQMRRDPRRAAAGRSVPVPAAGSEATRLGRLQTEALAALQPLGAAAETLRELTQWLLAGERGAIPG